MAPKTLSDLFAHYATPKGEYPPVYEMLLAPLRKELIFLLEIGIGTMTEGAHSNMRDCALPGYRPGNSLRAWRDYFPEGQIVGVDVQPDTQFTEYRITTALLDSTKKTVRFLKLFDVIIDDGSHVKEDILKTLRNFYPALCSPGYYFIEDIANTGLTLADLKQALAELGGHNDLVFIAGETWKMAVIKKMN